MDKTMQEKLAQYLVLYALAYIMFKIPQTHYICIVNNLYYSQIAKVIYICTIYGIVAVVFALCIFRKSIKLSEYELLFSVLIILLLLCCHNALSNHKAIYGEPGRNEGLLMLLCYYTVFYTARLLTDEKIRTALINIFLAITAAHALYGLGQFFELDRPFIYDAYHYAVSGVAGNPNFMGSLMVMACGACLGMLIYTKNLLWKIIYGALMPVFMATLIFTKTMSAYVGLSAIILTLFLIYVRKIYGTKGRKAAAAFVGIAVVSGLVLLYTVDRLAYGIVTAEITGIINQMKNGVNIETFASGRFLIWSNIFKMLPEYLLFGVGIDGLKRPYSDRFGLFKGAFLDKAHNELIHVLITMGLPVLICYIVLYTFTAKDLSGKIKGNSNKPVNMALFLAITGYLTQAMFNISVIDVAPYFWILLGLAAKPMIE
ncbi:MAG: O-antigen ligase family protein [Oscillospiraceae bacterium]|nr:O-antigen ligase family protein [Oscillospiraceae bacterium]